MAGDSWLDESLHGPDALAWLSRRFKEDAGRLVDSGITAVGEGFGQQAELAAFVPLAPASREFFIGVRGDVSRDEDWQGLVLAHEVLLHESQRWESIRSQALAWTAMNVVLDPDPPDARPLSEITSYWFPHEGS